MVSHSPARNRSTSCSKVSISSGRMGSTRLPRWIRSPFFTGRGTIGCRGQSCLPARLCSLTSQSGLRSIAQKVSGIPVQLQVMPVKKVTPHRFSGVWPNSSRCVKTVPYGPQHERCSSFDCILAVYQCGIDSVKVAKFCGAGCARQPLNRNIAGQFNDSGSTR